MVKSKNMRCLILIDFFAKMFVVKDIWIFKFYRISRSKNICEPMVAFKSLSIIKNSYLVEIAKKKLEIRNSEQIILTQSGRNIKIHPEQRKHLFRFAICERGNAISRNVCRDQIYISSIP